MESIKIIVIIIIIFFLQFFILYSSISTQLRIELSSIELNNESEMHAAYPEVFFMGATGEDFLKRHNSLLQMKCVMEREWERTGQLWRRRRKKWFDALTRVQVGGGRGKKWFWGRKGGGWGGQLVNFRAAISERAEASGSAGRLPTSLSNRHSDLRWSSLSLLFNKFQVCLEHYYLGVEVIVHTLLWKSIIQI